ncbi:MAG: putative HTH-type transcriptional regulator [Paracidovorax wautersii]|uniref:Putative HTH-type transcriptional regulator n=1 Tax=Paracidovorax wautersii TaxID=1177982 RepID=A0A7V8FPE2_9BURK|nr:MAG: putative HTH-type transcriptional regulator [Paracidovorax wautersii]
MAETQAVQATQIRRAVGRPRSEVTRSQILAATVRLLEQQSVQSISIEGIAREAGVGKATIYRWWSSKAHVVIDAFMEHHVVKTPMPRDVPPATAIARHLHSLIHEYAGWSGRIVAQIIGEGQSDPAVLREFRERFHYGRRAVVREMLEAWRSEGTIAAPNNIETLSDLLYAPIYMRLLLGHGPLDEEFARAHINYVYSLLGVDVPTLGASAKKASPARAASRKTSAVR